MSEWKPIESAPRDGTEVIAYGTRRGDWGYTEDSKEWTGVKWVAPSYNPNGRWEETRAAPRYSNGFVPTHWMPLPPPPEVEG